MEERRREEDGGEEGGEEGGERREEKENGRRGEGKIKGRKVKSLGTRLGTHHLLISMLYSQSELEVFFLSPPWLSPSSNLFRPCEAEVKGLTPPPDM